MKPPLAQRLADMPHHRSASAGATLAACPGGWGEQHAQPHPEPSLDGGVEDELGRVKQAGGSPEPQDTYSRSHLGGGGQAARKQQAYSTAGQEGAYSEQQAEVQRLRGQRDEEQRQYASM